MGYVLRTISPPGKSPLAHEATAPALAKAALEGTVVYGPYLEWFDPDGRDGRGEFLWTYDLNRAKRFLTYKEAMRCWQKQSTVRPYRDDGRPNRPMTAFSVTPEFV